MNRVAIEINFNCSSMLSDSIFTDLCKQIPDHINFTLNHDANLIFKWKNNSQGLGLFRHNNYGLSGNLITKYFFVKNVTDKRKNALLLLC